MAHSQQVGGIVGEPAGGVEGGGEGDGVGDVDLEADDPAWILRVGRLVGCAALRIAAAKKGGKLCLYFTTNGVPLRQQWESVRDELRLIRIFQELGVRMMHLTYNRRNPIGDGAGESNDGGLSDFGHAVAQLAGVTLTIGQQLMMMLTLMLTSKGVAAVPRASLVILSGTLTTFGLPLEGVAVILGVDAFMDMARTSVNLLGNCVASGVMARWEGEFRTS